MMLQPMSGSAGAVGRDRAGWLVLGELFDQLRVLTSSDLRARYGRGRWQLVKWLVDPFALVGVYLLMDRFIFYHKGFATGLSIACAIIPFQLITMTVTGSFDTLRLRQSIIANMRFRRGLLPISTALTETVGFSASLTLLAVMMAAYGVAPTISLLWLPLALVVTVLFGIAIAYPMTLIGVWAADIKGLMLSAVRAAYFLAPGLVTLAAIHGRTNSLVRVNPLTGLFEALRHAVYYRSSPPAWELLYPLAFALLVLIIFVPIYNREQKHFAKVIE
jgi:lipopolysaccharide transport system permease protein